MTAYKNRKAALAVTAGLVGALTLGGAVVAPAAAFAADGAELQWVQPETVLKNAVFTYSVNGITFESNTSDVAPSVTFVKGKPVTVYLAKLTLSVPGADDVEVDLGPNGENFEVKYFARDAKGNPTGDAIDEVTDPGEYVAVITAVKGDYKGGYVYAPFDVAARDANVKVDGSTTFTYDATAHKVKLYDDANNNGRVDKGEQLDEGVDYDAKYTTAGHDGEVEAEVKDAGDYTVYFTGKGEYKGSIEFSNTITVNALDLSVNEFAPSFDQVRYEPIVTTSSKEPQAPEVVWVKQNGTWERHEGDQLVKELQAQLDRSAGKENYLDDGTYTFQVSPVKENDDNFLWTEHTKSPVYVYKVKASDEAVFSYKGAELPTEAKVVTSDYATKFFSSDVKAKSADGKKTYTVKKYIVNGLYETEGQGNWNETPGTYTVVFTAEDAAGNVYGKAVVKVTTVKDALNADANAYAVYNKKVVTSVEKVYDGVDARNGLSFVVKDNAGAPLAEGTDYTVTYYDAAGREVTKLVNAGTYTAKLTSSKYDLSGTTELTITVKKVASFPVSLGAEITARFDNTDNGFKYVPWDKAGYTVEDLEVKADLDGDGEYDKLDLKAYKAVILNAKGEQVKKATDEGVYTLHFTGRDTDNFEVPADIQFTVVKDGTNGEVNHLRFADVAYTDYFADPVDYVAASKLMNGYADSKVFGSYDNLTRGQVACVLFNMATAGNKVDEDSLHFSELHGYETGFSDVDGKLYYGKAIAWAKQSGVVNGYGDGTFAPDKSVTREEFASMLANYVKKFGDFRAADADALDKVSDAGTVSDWAKANVAWAVENGVMGNGGFVAGQSTITRADTACMVYNYAK